MAYKHMPDLAVPLDEFRCEAMTKPTDTYQEWRRNPHRCVRTAKQGRDGRSVCALHAAVKSLNYWNGEPDSFPWSIRHQRRRERRQA